MDKFFTRMRAFFNPRASIPDEEEHHKEANSERMRRIEELKAQLAMSSLDDRLKAITVQLSGGK